MASKPKQYRTRGQVLVVACLVLLVLALMLMASFSVASAVHERIRLQATADAHAFSIATLEARSFNTIAYMNRSIAGAIVAELGLHSWRAIVLRDISMYKAGKEAFVQVAGIEGALCIKSKKHCAHAAEAAKISAQYGVAQRQAQNTLSNKEHVWAGAVRGFSEMIKRIYFDERVVLDKLRVEISGNGPTLRAIAFLNAPQALLKPLAADNVFGLACAVEGANFDSECTASPPWKTTTGVSSPASRTLVMESAAEAARPKFEIQRKSWRHLSGGGFRNGSMSQNENDPRHSSATVIRNPSKMMAIQGQGSLYLESESTSSTSLHMNQIGARVRTGAVLVVWKHGTGVSQTKATQDTGPYEGVPCNGSGGCFINFRSSVIGGETDYGQPATYGAFSQSLRSLKLGGRGAWEIDGTGSVRMPGAPWAKMKYVPDGNAVAIAKGKTYFHQLGPHGWSVPPNLFDPFWRAKLHPFKRAELAALLAKVGDINGSMVIASGLTAVEGVSP